MRVQTNFIKRSNAYGEEYHISYSCWGNPESKKILLCLHGLNRNGRDFDYVAEYFLGLGYYIVAPDLPGRGNSNHLRDGRGYDLESSIADLLAFMHQLQLSGVDCIGTSLGGAMGMILASLPQTNIRKLIMNDVGAEVELSGIARIASYSGDEYSFNSYEDACEHYRQYCLSDGIYDESVWQHMFNCSFQKNKDHKWGLKRDSKVAMSLAHGMLGGGNINLWAYWEKVNLPALIIHGVNSDLLLQSTIDKMRHTHPDTELLTIEDAGHSPYLYRAEHIKRIAQFLVS